MDTNVIQLLFQLPVMFADALGHIDFKTELY